MDGRADTAAPQPVPVAVRVPAGFWEYAEWQPDLERRAAALQADDVAALDDRALAAHTDRALALFHDGCRRHFLLQGAFGFPVAELVFTAEQLLGWPEAQTFRLLTGLSVVATRPVPARGDRPQGGDGRPGAARVPAGRSRRRPRGGPRRRRRAGRAHRRARATGPVVRDRRPDGRRAARVDAAALRRLPAAWLRPRRRDGGAGRGLVCRVAAPVWSMVFPSVGAVVTDSGGPLSHSAIIAREYRVPAVVGTGSATSTLHDGQVVTVDGTTGLVNAVG